jgi:hypothetical protein
MRIRRILYVTEGDMWTFQDNFAGVPGVMETKGYEVRREVLRSATFDTYKTWVSTFKPDVVFCFLRGPAAIQKMASYIDEFHPAITVNWFQEDPNQVDADVLKASRSYDYWFTINALMVPFWPTKAYFMPPGFDEASFRDFGLSRDYLVSYVGKLGHPLSTKMYMPYMAELSMYKRKVLLAIDRPMGVPLLPWPLERTLRKAAPILRCLPIWKCTWWNPKDEKEKAEFINRSRIHFGISRVRGYWEENLLKLLPEYPIGEDGLFYQIKGRLFQGAAAGAMVLNDYIPELEEMFDIGKEVVAFEYGRLDDLREKLGWYARHDEERARIAKAGYARAHATHTFGARVDKMMSIIEMNA